MSRSCKVENEGHCGQLVGGLTHRGYPAGVLGRACKHAMTGQLPGDSSDDCTLLFRAKSPSCFRNLKSSNFKSSKRILSMQVLMRCLCYQHLH